MAQVYNSLSGLVFQPNLGFVGLPSNICSVRANPAHSSPALLFPWELFPHFRFFFA